MAIFLFGLAVHGLLLDGVFAFRRYPQELILRAEQPFWFGLTVLIYLGLGALMAAFSAFFFWSQREVKDAEERFFRQRKYLE